jgi:acetyl esterase/lipase
VSADTGLVGGVNSIVVGPADAPLTVVYFHGGGYRMGSAGGWVPFAKSLSVAAAARVVLPDYRLAPEDPFPAALHDAAAVYEAMLVEVGSDGFVVAGDSAGGGLAAAVILAAMASGVAPPAAFFAISPWLDLTVRAETFQSRSESDRLFSAESARAAAELYLQGEHPDHPLVSPLFAELAIFPRSLLLAGTAEVLLDDSLSFAARLARAGVSVDLHVAAGMGHVWPVLFPDTPQAQQAMSVISSFLTQARVAQSS